MLKGGKSEKVEETFARLSIWKKITAHTHTPAESSKNETFSGSVRITDAMTAADQASHHFTFCRLQLKVYERTDIDVQSSEINQHLRLTFADLK